jgi:hypothetical protein
MGECLNTTFFAFFFAKVKCFTILILYIYMNRQMVSWMKDPSYLVPEAQERQPWIQVSQAPLVEAMV